MHPPTPYPAPARSKSKLRNEAHDTAFQEITAKANAVSKSEQDFSSVIKKTEGEVTGKHTSKTPRRYSVASKFAGPKAENANIVSSGLQAKPKLSKRASIQGIVSGPQFNSVSTQASLASRKNTTVPYSRLTTKGTSVISLQAGNLKDLPKRESLASEQGTKLCKPPSDSLKRSVCGHEKEESAHTIKARGLKCARYWLEQVKLAEVMEKHGVSIGFFRLAVECEAEPLDLLKEELIAYIKRFSLWSSTIQQVLLCYDVTEEVQDTLFSQITATGASESSSPCTPAKKLESIFLNEKDPADQVSEKILKSSDGGFENEVPEDTVDVSPKDTADVKEETRHSEITPVPDATGHVESMDAESLKREVVLYLMSSLGHPGKDDVFSQPKDNLTIVCPAPNNHVSRAVVVAEDSEVSAQESISILNSMDPEEAMSTGSLPSLNVWNTLSKEVDTGRSDEHKEVSITLDDDMNDSHTMAKVTGEEMCVSMELDVDDTMSDNRSDLASKSHSCECVSSEEIKCHAAQIAGEMHGNLAKALGSNEAISAGEKHEGLPKSIHNKSQDVASEVVQVSEKRESGSRKNQKIKSLPPKSETEKSTASQMTGVSVSKGNRRTSCTFGGRHQYGKERSTPASDRKRTESSALNKDNTAAVAAPTSRRLSMSTPRSSTFAHMPNVDAGSKTRSKSRICQPTELGKEINDMCLKSPTAEPEGILATPRQDRTVEVKVGSKQASLSNIEGMDAQTTDVVGLMATPGSAGLRRSARLIKSSEDSTMSTPGSVSAPCLQRRLGTPMKAAI
eukprot:c22775_g1_i2 orf=435-2810(-)